MSNVSHRLMCPNSLGKFGTIWDFQVLAGSFRLPLPSSFLQLWVCLLKPQAQVSWSVFFRLFDHNNRKGKETKGAKGLCHCFHKNILPQPRLALSVMASASLSQVMTMLQVCKIPRRVFVCFRFNIYYF